MKYITVPKNKEGIRLCNDSSTDGNDNLICTSISQVRLDEIVASGIIDRINSECDLLIDDFESERIEGINIETCLHLMNGSFPELQEALNQAKKYNTFVDLDF